MRWPALLALVLAVSACSAQGPVVPREPAASPAAAPATAGTTAGGSTAGVLEARRRAGIGDCPQSDPTAAARPDGLPDVVLDCLGADSRVRLAGLRGTPTIVNVWAQWCGPCRQESPALVALQDQLGDRVRLIGIDFADPQPELAVEFARQAGHRFPQVVDPARAVAGPLKVVGPPMTLFVAPDGRIAYRHVGPLTSPSQALDLARTHLRVSP